jgi:hypothetical protein
MKLTKTKLKQLIKEELNKVLKEDRGDLRVKNIRKQFSKEELDVLNLIYGKKRMSDRRGSQTYGHKDDWDDWVTQPVDGRIHQFINDMRLSGKTIEDLIDELKYKAETHLEASKNVDAVLDQLEDHQWDVLNDYHGDAKGFYLELYVQVRKNNPDATPEEMVSILKQQIKSDLGEGDLAKEYEEEI